MPDRWAAIRAARTAPPEDEPQLIEVKGIKGDPGPQGPQGPEGAAGKDGRDGRQGPAGEDGADGAPGAQGPRGEAGKQGPQGLAGKDGVNGKDGRDGVPPGFVSAELQFDPSGRVIGMIETLDDGTQMRKMVVSDARGRPGRVVLG